MYGVIGFQLPEIVEQINNNSGTRISTKGNKMLTIPDGPDLETLKEIIPHMGLVQLDLNKMEVDTYNFANIDI